MMELDTKIVAHLERRLPEWVRRVETREALDPEGESVLLIFLVVDPGAPVFQKPEILEEARDVVAEVFDEEHVGLWPYVRFVSETEWGRAARA